MRHKHFEYQTSVRWTEGRKGTIRAPERPELTFASPREFGGEGGMWTPEDFFVAAVNTCTMTTFLALADREGLQVATYECDATGLLEYVEGYEFTRVALRPHIEIVDESQLDLARRLVDKAHDRCLIAKSVRSDVLLEPAISVAEPSTAAI
ncbi:MAG: OsmC family protein [Thermoanaerobaculia bacterium]|nr:OsmC family protein [Thermoanaerobaculia bacterium]